MGGPHELRLRVRYSETDQMGVVHHSCYLVYLEEGRTALMRDLGFPYDEVERRGFGMAVRRAELRFRAAARYGDVLVVQTSVEHCRGASILYSTAIRRESDDLLLATGTAEVACLLLRDGFRPTPIPDDIRAALARHAPGRGRDQAPDR
jgi:acyl-CoA thioester hydrolase